MLTTLLSVATGNGRSAAYYEAKDNETVRVAFSGTIGTATIALEVSPVDAAGSTFIATGASFVSGAVTPVMVELRAGDRLYANQTGVGGGTSSTVRVQ